MFSLKKSSNKSNLILISSSLIIFINLFIGSSHADDFLDPVVVIGSKIEQPLSNVLPSVTVITKEEIQKSQAQSIADLLQGEPGFEFTRNGGPGNISSFFLRGENSVNVAIYVDDVRVGTDGLSNIDTSALPNPATIDHIEILRGNAGALYGESAIGGVINIYTKADSNNAPKAYATVSMGTYKTFEEVIGVGGRTGDTKFNINLNQQTSSGFAPINNTVYPFQYINPNAGASNSQGINATISQILTKDIELGANARYQMSNIKYDDISAGPCGNLNLGYCTGVGDGSGPNSIFNMKTETTDLGVFSKFNIYTNWKSRVDYSYSKILYDFSSSETTSNVPTLNTFSNYETIVSSDNIKWNNIYSINKNNQITFGIDYSLQRYSDGFGDTMQRTSQGLYSGYLLKISNLDLQLNARHDALNINEDGSGYPTASYGSNTGLFGVGYWITDNFKLTSSISSGFRAPSAGEIFGLTQMNAGANTYNPSLKPETHTSVDYGAEFVNRFTTTRITHFDTSTSNQITYLGSFNNYNGGYTNIGKVRNKGFEFSERAKWGGYTIVSAYTLQNPVDQSTGMTLLRRAKEYGSFMLDKSFGENDRFDLGSKVILSGSRSDAFYDPNTRANTNVTLSSYQIWSFFAGMKINDEYLLRANIENAFNENYETVYGYNTPGKTLRLTLIYQQK
jgi:vitamin B12 transporter